MAGFDNGVATPGGASFVAPEVSFDWLKNLPNDYFRGVFNQQQQGLNDQSSQLNAQTIQKNAQVEQIRQQLGQLDFKDPDVYRKAATLMSAMGNPAEAFGILQNQPAPLSPMFGGQGAPGAAAGQPQPQPQGAPGPAPASVPAPPLRGANTGDPGSNTLTSLVTDKLPSQNQTTGETIVKIAQVMGIDPNATLTPGQMRRAQGLLQKYAPDIAGQPGGGGGGGNLPPSANAGTPAPRSSAQPQAAPNGAPSGQPPQPAPQPGPQAVPQQQPQGGGPLVAPVRLPNDPRTGKPFTSPQDAIAALVSEIARLSTSPKAGPQAALLKEWRDRIEKMVTPIEARPGATFLDPQTGRPIAQVPTATGGNPQVIGKIADSIANGSQPPELTGLYSMTGPVRAALDDKGFDLSKARLEWDRAKKQVASLNGPQMLKFKGLAGSVDKTIDEVRDLSEKLDLGGVSFLNKGELMRYLKLEGNSEKGQLVSKYIGAVNTLKEEFANLAQGGYAPTEAVWKLANEQINADYGRKQLGASLDEIQRLIRYRVSAIPNMDTLGPGGENRYAGQPPAQAAAPPQQSSGSTTWVRGADGQLKPQ